MAAGKDEFCDVLGCVYECRLIKIAGDRLDPPDFRVITDPCSHRLSDFAAPVDQFSVDTA